MPGICGNHYSPGEAEAQEYVHAIKSLILLGLGAVVLAIVLVIALLFAVI